MLTDTYYGPFTIVEVERCIGDFTMVWMKPHDTRVVRGPDGQRPLYAVGCAWPCGCEVRGPSYVNLRTSRWAPCRQHQQFVLWQNTPQTAVPEEQCGGILVPRDQATRRQDEMMLFEAVPYSL